MKSRNKCIGITLGDPTGIGPEVVAKALSKPSIRKLGSFKIFGDSALYRKHCPSNYRNCTLIDLKNSGSRWKPGKPNLASAKASLNALQNAIHQFYEGEITSLVTAPICKEYIHRIDSSFQGHTEYLAKAFKVKNFGMMFVAGKMKTIVVTRHVPLNKVSALINSSNVYQTIVATDNALKSIFKIRKPSIALCGLNPHAGEGGTIGKEEITKIVPAIKRSRRQKINVSGPFPADTLFSPSTAQQYDAIIAMYHDQGLIPVKTMRFNNLVNLTIGLPLIRTSPAHGTAFDIAGKNKANPSSMCAAIKLASQLNV